MDLEELCGAAVETDALALVEVAFVVVVGDALERAGFGEAIWREDLCQQVEKNKKRSI